MLRCRTSENAVRLRCGAEYKKCRSEVPKDALEGTNTTDQEQNFLLPSRSHYTLQASVIAALPVTSPALYLRCQDPCTIRLVGTGVAK